MAVITGAAIAAAGVAAGVAGTVSSANQAKKARKQADQARMDEMGFRRESAANQEERIDFFRNIYDDWRNQYQPAIEELQAQAFELERPDYAAITADNRLAFGSARDQSGRNLMRFGVKPGDGAFGSNERRFAIGQAASEVNARQAARRQADNERFGRLLAYNNTGIGLRNLALGQVGAGYDGVSNALVGQANTAGRNADFYSGRETDHANNAYSSASQIAPSLGQFAGALNGVFGSTGSSTGTAPASSYGSQWAVYNPPSTGIGYYGG